MREAERIIFTVLHGLAASGIRHHCALHFVDSEMEGSPCTANATPGSFSSVVCYLTRLPLARADRHFRFSFFQVFSAFSNTGTSLVDQSMIPFQTAYPMILVMIFLILAGNTAFVCSYTP